jgi:hypothetical protein
VSREFIKEINKGISEMCKEIGFKKKQYFFIKPYTENVIAVLCWGIYTRQMRGHVFVSAFVGVTYKDVEELFCKLCGIDNPVFDFTILKQIGYVMPEDSYKEWDFVEGSDNSGIFKDLFRHIKTYGFEYFEKMKDFNNLFQTFEKGSVLNISRDRRLPILYYLKGEKEKGLKFIEEALERQQHGGVEDFDMDYPDFAERYKAL